MTEETRQKAMEISPGSQPRLLYLSSAELNELSPSGLPSRPCVEYSEESVQGAVSRKEHVSMAKHSPFSPENPHDLLLPARTLQRLRSQELSIKPPACIPHTISDEDWRIVHMNLAKAFQNFDECYALAQGLELDDRDGDIVQRLREESPGCELPLIAFKLFERWVKSVGSLSVEERRSKLGQVFSNQLGPWRTVSIPR